MRFSRAGIIVLILSTVLIGANCSYYNRVMARKDLVDGATAYKERKFAVAEDLFRSAVSRDPEGKTLEGKTAQVFLARTLHSIFIGDRKRTETAEAAIEEYKRALELDITDQSSYRAVANLYENLGKQEEWRKWVIERANNPNVPPGQRAEAFTSLAAKKNTCANDITDVPAVKKEITKGEERVYEFVKPEDSKLLELKQCVEEGKNYINQAIELEKQAEKDSDSTWSYKASLLVQEMRLAEMEGRTADKEALKKQADEAKEKFNELAEASRKAREEEEAKKKAEEEAANKDNK